MISKNIPRKDGSILKCDMQCRASYRLASLQIRDSAKNWHRLSFTNMLIPQDCGTMKYSRSHSHLSLMFLALNTLIRRTLAIKLQALKQHIPLPRTEQGICTAGSNWIGIMSNEWSTFPCQDTSKRNYRNMSTPNQKSPNIVRTHQNPDNSAARHNDLSKAPTQNSSTNGVRNASKKMLEASCIMPVRWM